MTKAESIKVRLLDGRTLSFVGREAWCLRRLHNAGAKGLTTIDHPAPRWSHYVFKLRRAGLIISTDFENHGGTFPGHHGRYRLETPVTIVEEVAA
jgi:winged helix domain-containing protein